MIFCWILGSSFCARSRDSYSFHFYLRMPSHRLLAHFRFCFAMPIKACFEHFVELSCSRRCTALLFFWRYWRPSLSPLDQFAWVVRMVLPWNCFWTHLWELIQSLCRRCLLLISCSFQSRRRTLHLSRHRRVFLFHFVCHHPLDQNTDRQFPCRRCDS